MTRPAVVHHLQALGGAGLVDAHRNGREVRYEATPQALAEALEWTRAAGARWDRRLARLQA